MTRNPFGSTSTIVPNAQKYVTGNIGYPDTFSANNNASSMETYIHREFEIFYFIIEYDMILLYLFIFKYELLISCEKLYG